MAMITIFYLTPYHQLEQSVTVPMRLPVKQEEIMSVLHGMHTDVELTGWRRTVRVASDATN